MQLSDPKLLEDSNWTYEQNKTAGEHFMYLKNLVSDNVVILAGRSIEKDAFCIVLYKAETREDVLEIMNGDPAVKKKLMTAELHEFSLALLNTNL